MFFSRSMLMLGKILILRYRTTIKYNLVLGPRRMFGVWRHRINNGKMIALKFEYIFFIIYFLFWIQCHEFVRVCEIIFICILEQTNKHKKQDPKDPRQGPNIIIIIIQLIALHYSWLYNNNQ